MFISIRFYSLNCDFCLIKNWRCYCLFNPTDDVLVGFVFLKQAYNDID